MIRYCENSQISKSGKIECTVGEFQPCIYQKYCRKDTMWKHTEEFSGCARKGENMSKNKKNNIYSDNKYNVQKEQNLEEVESEIDEELVETNTGEEILYLENEEKDFIKEVKTPFLNKKGTVILAEPTFIIVLDDLGNGITLRHNLDAKVGDIVEY